MCCAACLKNEGESPHLTHPRPTAVHGKQLPTWRRLRAQHHFGAQRRCLVPACAQQDSLRSGKKLDGHKKLAPRQDSPCAMLATTARVLRVIPYRKLSTMPTNDVSFSSGASMRVEQPT
jgi:hypothetical protein